MSAEPVRPGDTVDEATTRKRKAAMKRIRALHAAMRERTGDRFIEVDDVLEEIRRGDIRNG